MEPKANVIDVGRDVSAIRQGVRILRYLASTREPCGVTAIARASDVSPSTTLNILRTLVNEGLVGFDPAGKTYRMDIGVLELARPLLNQSRVDMVRPHLRQISTRFGALASMWKPLVDDKLMLIDRVTPDVDVRLEMRIATRLPLGAGALGRIILAQGEHSQLKLRQTYAAVRWTNPLPFETYMDDIKAARERGYGIDRGNLIGGVTSVAACITLDGVTPVIAFSASTVTGQLSDADIETLGRDLASLCAWAGPALYDRNGEDAPAPT